MSRQRYSKGSIPIRPPSEMMCSLHSLLAVVLLLLCCQLWNVSSWHVQRHQKGSHLKTFCTSPRLVALTREKGENEKLKILLEKHSQIRCLELPCIEFRTCSAASLVKQLMPTTDLMIITSPQAASVIIPIWKSLGSPDVKVISLGVGTSKPLLAAGITPIFQPSQALASVLAQELPTHFGHKVLYPTSTLSDGSLVRDLQVRGFLVHRVDAYETLPAAWTEDQRTAARSVDLVTLGSPSTAEAWAQHLGISPGSGYTTPAVVIGPSSARAAHRLGFETVICPPEGSKGLLAWASAITRSLGLE